MNHYNKTGPTRVGRSIFDLSYSKLLTGDMGYLYPVMHDEVVPGDIFKIGNQVVLRMQPLVAPILHEINLYVHYYFVPIRILWDDWEDFITGGADGTEAPTLPVKPLSTSAAGDLYDYLGFPIGVSLPVGFQPVSFAPYAYNMIYNEYYRDQELIAEVDITTQKSILKRAWEKDYFTSSLTSQQRGTAPALPISGTIDVDAKDEDILMHNETDATDRTVWLTAAGALQTGTNPSGVGDARFGAQTGLEVDLSGGTTFDVADLRLAFQQQKFLERNNRAGARYTEQLRAHYGVSPRDDRLDRPEYIGGSKQPVITSEVLQTESSDATTPQGNMSGHGISVDSSNICTYRVKEHGIIMAILSVMPRSSYSSQGVPRQWLKSTRYDYYFPEFANLSEQAIYEGELYASATLSEDQTIFGYQGRYDEMRTKENLVCGDFRSTYDYWHLSRQFSSRPSLNQSFIECTPRKDIFAAPSEDGLLIHFHNKIKAIRPMPIISNPGLIDH